MDAPFKLRAALGNEAALFLVKNRRPFWRIVAISYGIVGILLLAMVVWAGTGFIREGQTALVGGLMIVVLSTLMVPFVAGLLFLYRGMRYVFPKVTWYAASVHGIFALEGKKIKAYSWNDFTGIFSSTVLRNGLIVELKKGRFVRHHGRRRFVNETVDFSATPAELLQITEVLIAYLPKEKPGD